MPKLRAPKHFGFTVSQVSKLRQTCDQSQDNLSTNLKFDTKVCLADMTIHAKFFHNRLILIVSIQQEVKFPRLLHWLWLTMTVMITHTAVSHTANKTSYKISTSRDADKDWQSRHIYSINKLSVRLNLTKHWTIRQTCLPFAIQNRFLFKRSS